MIPIHKMNEPPELAPLRAKAAKCRMNPDQAYDLLIGRSKKRVRRALVREQGGLCAYCMCRIPREDVPPHITPIVIEHIIPREPPDGRDVGQGLNYYNMLAVCNGNRGPHGTRCEMDLTCDAHRSNQEFRKVNPCKPDTLKSIFYHYDGRIDAEDPDVKYDLVEILNLNCPTAPLVSERQATLSGLIEYLISGMPEDPEEAQEYLLDVCRRELRDLEGETQKKTPYVGILLWYLRETIRNLEET